MIELIIGIGVGYFLGRFAGFASQPHLDRLLIWDPAIFAWRVVPQGSRLDVTRKYLAATDVILDDSQHMKRYSEPQDRR